MKSFVTKFTICLLLVSFLAAGSAFATSYQYVGSWFVDEGPWWSNTDQNGNYTTPVLSGIEAAAYIFGGDAADYVISTVSSSIDDINFSAWMDGWADSSTYGYSGNPAAMDLHIDVDGDGLYATSGGYGSAYSAYVSDHSLHLENYAFLIIDDEVAPVPEPATILLLGSGLLGLGLYGRKRNKA